jgi:hypothetical protein
VEEFIAKKRRLGKKDLTSRTHLSVRVPCNPGRESCIPGVPNNSKV